jgi:ABC-2 type transport system ATP-binding protein
MLTGVLDPTDGTASIQCHDIRTEALLSRAHLGVVPEQANVYLDLSVWRNVMLMAELHGVPRPQRVREGERLLDALGLGDRKTQKARALSKGLRQRLMLCAALVTGPEVLFLDEPTSGLDVQSARLIRRIVGDLNRDGLTVFLTTHNMDEAEAMCSRLAIINHGRIAAIDTPEALRSMMRTSQYVEVRFDGQAPATEELAKLPDVSRVTSEAEGIRLYTETPGQAAVQAVRFADEKGLVIAHLCTRKPSLEDIFLSLTAEQTEEGKA